MSSNYETRSLTALSRDLMAYSGQAAPVGYRRLWSMAVDGQLPVVQVNGRWRYRPDDVPRVAAKLGIAPAAAPTETSAAA